MCMSRLLRACGEVAGGPDRYSNQGKSEAGMRWRRTGGVGAGYIL